MPLKEEFDKLTHSVPTRGIIGLESSPYLILENNDWSADGYFHEQEVRYNVSDSKFGFSWRYNEFSEKVLAYPEVIYGRKPWSQRSTCPHLPKLVRDIDFLSVDFEYRSEATQDHNVAFDFWLLNDKNGNQDAIACEVMIWCHSQGRIVPAGRMIATELPYVQLGGHSLSLYYDEPRHDRPWAYYAFVPQGKVVTDEVYVSAFLKYLRRVAPSIESMYLSSVEFGAEIMRGEGTLIVDHYEVHSDN